MSVLHPYSRIRALRFHRSELEGSASRILPSVIQPPGIDMLQRTKQTLALSLMVPLVASVGITAASTSSSAAVTNQQSYNGSFNAGRAGWYFGTPHTRVSIVN